MKIISKSQILALTLSLGIFLTLGSASAFTPPTVGKPTSANWQNSAEPVDESAVGQLKPGGLSVDTFFANGEALFMQVLDLKGLVNGGTETDTNSTVAFGDGANQTNLDLTGKLRSNISFTSESLAHSGSGLEPICADTQGRLYLCAEGPTSVQCGNNVMDPGEQCDDGNIANGDGCSSICQNESMGIVNIYKEGLSPNDTDLFVNLDGPSTYNEQLEGVYFQTLKTIQVIPGTYNLSASCEATTGFFGNQRAANSPELKFLIPETLISVSAGQTYDITGHCDCVRDTGNNCL